MFAKYFIDRSSGILLSKTRTEFGRYKFLEFNLIVWWKILIDKALVILIVCGLFWCCHVSQDKIWQISPAIGRSTYQCLLFKAIVCFSQVLELRNALPTFWQIKRGLNGATQAATQFKTTQSWSFELFWSVDNINIVQIRPRVDRCERSPPKYVWRTFVADSWHQIRT